MKYSEVIKEFEYWKRMLGEDDPEIVINVPPYSYEIAMMQPVKGVYNNKAIGIIIN